ncbi:toll/interleukin-1 receptor domain-containing protein [Glaciecola sp. MF2-115]|uniref:toll/interleukin-1 receptor domain-containing protein n=1 Tax=Glaciecola sp. MF2-115 TaxID=3384827 RepID=UPI0039A3A5FD
MEFEEQNNSAPQEHSNEYKYHAFISYRHADNKEQGRQWATWLHQAIETYEVPSDLVGKKNAHGTTIPARIYPIFRDEDELPAHADLGASIVSALEQTNLLIVLCSPRAVASTYVAEEIDYFKKLGHSDRIIAAMIDGEPNSSWDEGKQASGFSKEDECFPLPLQFEYNTDGKPTDKRAEPIAADFRVNINGKSEQGFTTPAAYREYLSSVALKSDYSIDNKAIDKLVNAYQKQIHLMLLKIIAGILGVPLGELTQRDKEYQLEQERLKARKLRQWLAAVGVLALVAIGTGGVAYKQSKAASEANTLALNAKFEEQQAVQRASWLSEDRRKHRDILATTKQALVTKELNLLFIESSLENKDIAGSIKTHQKYYSLSSLQLLSSLLITKELHSTPVIDRLININEIFSSQTEVAAFLGKNWGNKEAMIKLLTIMIKSIDVPNVQKQLYLESLDVLDLQGLQNLFTDIIGFVAKIESDELISRLSIIELIMPVYEAPNYEMAISMLIEMEEKSQRSEKADDVISGHDIYRALATAAPDWERSIIDFVQDGNYKIDKNKLYTFMNTHLSLAEYPESEKERFYRSRDLIVENIADSTVPLFKRIQTGRYFQKSMSKNTKDSQEVSKAATSYQYYFVGKNNLDSDDCLVIIFAFDKNSNCKHDFDYKDPTIKSIFHKTNTLKRTTVFVRGKSDFITESYARLYIFLNPSLQRNHLAVSELNSDENGKSEKEQLEMAFNAFYYLLDRKFTRAQLTGLEQFKEMQTYTVEENKLVDNFDIRVAKYIISSLIQDGLFKNALAAIEWFSSQSEIENMETELIEFKVLALALNEEYEMAKEFALKTDTSSFLLAKRVLLSTQSLNENHKELVSLFNISTEDVDSEKEVNHATLIAIGLYTRLEKVTQVRNKLIEIKLAKIELLNKFITGNEFDTLGFELDLVSTYLSVGELLAISNDEAQALHKVKLAEKILLSLSDEELREKDSQIYSEYKRIFDFELTYLNKEDVVSHHSKIAFTYFVEGNNSIKRAVKASSEQDQTATRRMEKAYETAEGSLVIAQRLLRNMTNLGFSNSTNEINRYYIISYQKLGDIRFARNDSKTALSLYNKSLELFKNELQLDPNHKNYPRDVLVLFNKVLKTLVYENRYSEALGIADEAITTIVSRGQSAEFQSFFRHFVHEAASISDKNERPEDAAKYYLSFFDALNINLINADANEKNIALIRENAEYYLGWSWYMLLTKDVRDVSTTLNKVILLLDESSETRITLHTNLAHAYLLSGNYDAAKLVYEKFKGQTVSGSKVWDDIIVDDFKSLQEKGIQHADFNRISHEVFGVDMNKAEEKPADEAA